MWHYLKKMKSIFFIFILVCFSISTIHAQSDSDSIKSIFVIAELMPECNISKNQLEEVLNNSISVSEAGFSNDDFIEILFIVTCNNEDVMYKIIQPEEKASNTKLLKIIQNNTSWTAGQQRGRNVDCRISMHILVSKGKFNLLDEKELKKYYRKKK